MCFERCDLEGLTSKAFTQVQKLATVYACARETLSCMFPQSENPATSFTVMKVDVLAAFEIIDVHEYVQIFQGIFLSQIFDW